MTRFAINSPLICLNHCFQQTDKILAAVKKFSNLTNNHVTLDYSIELNQLLEYFSSFVHSTFLKVITRLMRFLLDESAFNSSESRILLQLEMDCDQLLQQNCECKALLLCNSSDLQDVLFDYEVYLSKLITTIRNVHLKLIDYYVSTDVERENTFRQQCQVLLESSEEYDLACPGSLLL
ncbi:hypothetical protein GEMRC1_006927 [Eukaryota sp. GEM-RC1]